VWHEPEKIGKAAAAVAADWRQMLRLLLGTLPVWHTEAELFTHRDNIMPEIKQALDRLNNDHKGAGCTQVVF
jgi:hypothetical protein